MDKIIDTIISKIITPIISPIRAVPVGHLWILFTGSWRDVGEWIDTSTWNDGV